MNLTTATPVEIDTEIANRMVEMQQLRGCVARHLDTLHRIAGHRKAWGQKYYKESGDQAIETVKARLEGMFYYAKEQAQRALSELDRIEMVTNILADQVTPMEAEYRARGRWTRFYLVTSSAGHIHSNTACSHQGRTTYGWLPQYSGMGEAEALNKLGSAGNILCTKCFPNAPVEYTKAPEKSYCSGSGQRVPGSRTGAYLWGRCPGCGDTRKLTMGGSIPKHQPVKK